MKRLRWRQTREGEDDMIEEVGKCKRGKRESEEIEGEGERGTEGAG
jgi:hypothetical protein